MRKLFYTISIALVLVACGPDENTLLYNQVMDIHDEVMPKMEELYNKKKELQEQLKGNPEEDVRTDVELKISEIDAADKKMMDWMHSFNPPEKGANKEETKAYLEAELLKVKEVRDAILTALGSDVKN